MTVEEPKAYFPHFYHYKGVVYRKARVGEVCAPGSLAVSAQDEVKVVQTHSSAGLVSEVAYYVLNDEISVEGVKYDTGKLRYDLIPWDVMSEVAKVLTYGASKYTPDNWKHVDNAKSRYIAATCRHFLDQYLAKGLKEDEDGTGLNNLAQAITCLMFLLWFDLQDRKIEEDWVP